MTVHLDTSVLIDALTAPHRAARGLERTLDLGHHVRVSAIALYEWLRGPRTEQELLTQESLLPAHEAIPFGSGESHRAAVLYRRLARPKGRVMDLAIAACAIENSAALWTLNPKDFADIPGLVLYRVEY